MTRCQILLRQFTKFDFDRESALQALLGELTALPEPLPGFWGKMENEKGRGK